MSGMPIEQHQSTIIQSGILQQQGIKFFQRFQLRQFRRL
jgi:hypothetical protein